MDKKLTFSTVKREAHITVVELDAVLVAKLMEIQCTYMYNMEMARDMSLRLVKDLADGCGILTDEFHNELYRWGVLRKDGDVPSAMPEPVCHD